MQLRLCWWPLGFFTPEHWLRRVPTFGTVTIDDRPVNADLYLGNPTINEADAFLLVRIRGTGSYLFNFLDETYHEVPSKDAIPLHWGAIVIRPMSEGPWVTPLPSKDIDEFRVVLSAGKILKVKF